MSDKLSPAEKAFRFGYYFAAIHAQTCTVKGKSIEDFREWVRNVQEWHRRSNEDEPAPRMFQSLSQPEAGSSNPKESHERRID